MKMSILLHIVAFILMSVLPMFGHAQTSVGINTDKPNQNAVLELVSPGSNQGVLVPQLTSAQRNSPKFVASLSGKAENNGLLVFDRDSNVFFYWENTQWQSLLSKDLSRVVRAGNSTNGLTITGLIYPIKSSDAANKGYVDDTISRIIFKIENISNIVNEHTTQINQLTDSIFVYSQYFTTVFDSIYSYNEHFTILFDSIYSYNEHFTTLFDSIYSYNEHFTTLFDSIYSYNEHFTTLFDSIYSYNEHFTTLFDSIYSYNEHFTTIRDSIVRIQQIFEKAEFKLPQGDIYIGAATGLAKAVTVTGDVLFDGDAVTTIQPKSVTDSKLDKSNIPLSGFGLPLADIPFGNGTLNFRLTDIAPPVNANDAVTKSYSDIADTALSARIELNRLNINSARDLITIIRDSVSLVSAAVNNQNIGSLRDSVKMNKDRVKELSDTVVAQIAMNKTRSRNQSDSLNYIYKTGRLSLSNNFILMGGLNDTARPMTFSAHDFSISDAVYLADGAVLPKNISGISTNGTAGEILVSKGDGSFEWQGKFSGGMSNDLQNGYFWIGNASNKAAATSKTNIAISGFGSASANVAIGNGTTNYKITNVLNPTASQDVSTKKYVDDSLTIHNTAIKANAVKIATNKTDIAGINTKLNTAGLTNEAVPFWNTSKFDNSNIWSNGSKIFVGNAHPASYTYDFEINGSFKTQKIYHSSDERWKKDIQVLDSALLKVLMMNGVQYNWRKEEFPEKNFPTGLQIGLVAQQIEKIVPELVATDADGYKAVEYANMVAFLIEAIKSQQTIIDNQQKALNAVESQNEVFEKRLRALEQTKVKK